MITRRELIEKAFKVGGLAALYGLGLSSKEVHAWMAGGMGGGVAATAAEDYSDIIFYWGCNSTTPDKSAGDTLAAGGGGGEAIDTGLYFAGTGSVDSPSSYARYDFTLNNDDLIDVDAGRIGFAIYVDTLTANKGVFKASYDANNYISVLMWSSNRLIVNYVAGGSGTQYLATSTLTIVGGWHFFEMRFNKGDAGNEVEVYWDGNATPVATDNTASGTWTKGASGTLSIGDIEGNSGDFHIDQVMISNDPDRDLYALRNTTDLD